MTRAGLNQYTRKAVLDFLFQNGCGQEIDGNDVILDSKFSTKQLQLIAYGISIDSINSKKIKTPSMYVKTFFASLISFVVGLILMFVDPYIDFVNINILLYIVWCLCSLSMFFTNIVALEEWKKRHGQKKHKLFL